MALIKCPECGQEISDKSSVCIHCGYPINQELEQEENNEQKNLLLVRERLMESEKAGGGPIMCPWCNQLTPSVLNYCSHCRHSFCKAEYKPVEAPKIHCPRCGSTNIQMVSKKWSLSTGLLTNKVDRVCMNCKHRF